MKRVLIVLALIGLMLPVVAVAQSGKKNALKGIKCPVCKMQVSEENAVAYKGGKVFFGCAGCPEEFQKNTAKYAALANLQLVATGQAHQVACPLSGKAVNKKMKVAVGGTEVGLCCGRCKAALSKMAKDARIEKVFNDKAFAKAFEVGKKST